jgi:5-methylthioadenosine/S-adenosylhomocysteine deaminase
MTRTILRGAHIVTMNEAFDDFVGDLVVEGGRIVALAPITDTAPDEVMRARDGDEVIDCDGLTCIPGFVQTHVHLCQTLFRSLADDLRLEQWLKERIWKFEGALTAETMRVSADIGLCELSMSGTTTLLDMGTVHHTDAVGEAVEYSGMRAFLGKAMMDEGDDIPASLRETRAESIRESLALASRWHGRADGRIQYAFCPRFALSCSTELLREVGEICASEGYVMHTHSNETEWEVQEVSRRWEDTNIGYLHSLGLLGPKAVLAHGVHFVDDERAILRDTRTCVTHCPSSNLKLASGIADIPLLWQWGVRVGLGCDGAPCNNTMDAFQEMRLAAMIQKPIYGPTAMPARRVLQLATRDGAEVLGLEDEVGTLEVGKSADFLLLNLRQPHHGIDGPAAEQLGGSVYARIVYSARPSDVRRVYAGGEEVARDGKSVKFDTEELHARGREALTQILARR